MTYTDAQYAESLYGAGTVTTIEQADEETYYTDLKKYMPSFLLDMDEFDTCCEIDGEEVGRLRHYVEDLEDQTYISTATWGIKKWEKIYGIVGSESSTIEQRRAAVLMSEKGEKTFTPSLVKDIANEMTGVDVEVRENYSDYSFVVFFVGQYGVPKGIREFREWLEMAKPAHLASSIEYRYVIWREIASKRWDDLRRYTWQSIRVAEAAQTVTWHGIAAAMFTWKSLRKRTTAWKAVKSIEEAKE